MKLKKFALLILALLTITSCGGNSGDNSSKTSSAVESSWPEDFTKLCVDNLGTVIPFMEHDSIESVLSQDNFGDPMVIAYLTINDQELLDNAPGTYSSICENNGYSVSSGTESYFDEESMSIVYYDIYYADKVISDTVGIELQFLIGDTGNGVDRFGIFAFNYSVYSHDEWPSAMVTKYLGVDIPHLEGEGFKYSCWQLYDETDGEYIEVLVQGTEFNDELVYKDICEKAGYTIDDSHYDDVGYVAYASDMSHAMTFKYDTDYYAAVVIYIFKNNTKTN